MKRYVFMISDGTGITAETLGHSLITQFENTQFERLTIPYVDSLKKAEDALQQINHAFEEHGIKPLVFMTLIDPEIRNYFKKHMLVYLTYLVLLLVPWKKSLMKNLLIQSEELMVWVTVNFICTDLKQ